MRTGTSASLLFFRKPLEWADNIRHSSSVLNASATDVAEKLQEIALPIFETLAALLCIAIEIGLYISKSNNKLLSGIITSTAIIPAIATLAWKRFQEADLTQQAAEEREYAPFFPPTTQSVSEPCNSSGLFTWKAVDNYQEARNHIEELQTANDPQAVQNTRGLELLSALVGTVKQEISTCKMGYELIEYLLSVKAIFAVETPSDATAQFEELGNTLSFSKKFYAALKKVGGVLAKTQRDHEIKFFNTLLRLLEDGEESEPRYHLERAIIKQRIDALQEKNAEWRWKIAKQFLTVVFPYLTKGVGTAFPFLEPATGFLAIAVDTYKSIADIIEIFERMSANFAQIRAAKALIQQCEGNLTTPSLSASENLRTRTILIILELKIAEQEQNKRDNLWEIAETVAQLFSSFLAYAPYICALIVPIVPGGIVAVWVLPAISALRLAIPASLLLYKLTQNAQKAWEGASYAYNEHKISREREEIAQRGQVLIEQIKQSARDASTMEEELEENHTLWQAKKDELVAIAQRGQVLIEQIKQSARDASTVEEELEENHTLWQAKKDELVAIRRERGLKKWAKGFACDYSTFTERCTELENGLTEPKDRWRLLHKLMEMGCFGKELQTFHQQTEEQNREDFLSLWNNALVGAELREPDLDFLLSTVEKLDLTTCSWTTPTELSAR